MNPFRQTCSWKTYLVYADRIWISDAQEIRINLRFMRAIFQVYKCTYIRFGIQLTDKRWARDARPKSLESKYNSRNTYDTTGYYSASLRAQCATLSILRN